MPKKPLPVNTFCSKTSNHVHMYELRVKSYLCICINYNNWPISDQPKVCLYNVQRLPCKPSFRVWLSVKLVVFQNIDTYPAATIHTPLHWKFNQCSSQKKKHQIFPSLSSVALVGSVKQCIHLHSPCSAPQRQKFVSKSTRYAFLFLAGCFHECNMPIL